jgi:protein-disulfide isomerase-like protein with CxxC motif
MTTYTTAIRATDAALQTRTHHWIWSALRWQQHLVDTTFVCRQKTAAAISARRDAMCAFEEADRASYVRGGRGFLDC